MSRFAEFIGCSSSCDESSRRFEISFYRDYKTLLSLPARSVEKTFGVPIIGHVDLDLGAVFVTGAGALDARGPVHSHARYVHIDLEVYVANIEKLVVAVAELDDN